MTKFLSRALLGLLMFAAFAAPSFAAATLVNDQIPAPVPSASNTTQNSEVYTQYVTVPGGALYQTVLRQPGTGGQVLGGGTVFVPGGGGAQARYLNLIEGHSDLGVPMTAAAGTPAGTMGVARTAGTSLVLVGETTSSSAKTNKVIFQFNLPATYVAGANIPVVINANYVGGGTVTAASTTLTPTLYTEVNGVETALTVSAAQQFTLTGTDYTFTVTGTNLVPGQNVVLEVVMLVTTSAGGATGQINAIHYNG